MSLQQKVEEIFEDEGKNSSSLQEELKVNYYDFSQLSNQPTRVGDNIESDNVDASKSFEMFQGKLFKEYTTAGSGFSSNSLKSRLTHFFEEYGLLKNELDSLSKSTKSKDGSVWADMQIVAKQHIEDIESLLSKTNIQGTKEPIKKLTEDLATLNSQSKDGPTKTSASIATPSKYSPHHHNFAQLDKRLAVLESSVGPPTGSSLTKIASRLDQQVSLLESQAPEELVRRLSGLKAELQSLMGGKSQQSQREVKLLESAGIVRDLHSQMSLVRDTSGDLPLIVARLKSLDDVHRATVNTALRVEKLEALAAGLSQTLTSNNQILATLRKGMEDNITSLTKSIHQINERVEKLEKK